MGAEVGCPENIRGLKMLLMSSKREVNLEKVEPGRSNAELSLYFLQGCLQVLAAISEGQLVVKSKNYVLSK